MSILFTPQRIGRLEIRNRFVRSATAEKKAHADGSPSPAQAELYRALAEGGVGLIITGHAYVAPEGKCHPEMLGIYDDFLIPKLAELARAAHEGGAKIAVQINHGGRQVDPKLVEAGQVPLAPSPIANPATGYIPRELTTGEIEEIIQAYGQAARRAKEAGFDAVQIHGAHGYLVNQFLSPAANWREDGWGGDPERRLAFLREVYSHIRRMVGPDYPILIKLVGEDFCPGGLRLTRTLEVVRALSEWGIDAIEVSGGIAGPLGSSTRADIRTTGDEAYFLPWVKEVRKATQVPLMIVGGLRSRGVMDEILDEGVADFISMSRPFIREPDLVRRLQVEGKEAADCISCGLCSGHFGELVRCWVLYPGEDEAA